MGSERLDDLGTGDTLAVFHSSGSSPRLMEMLNSWVIAGVMLRAVSFSIRADISSWPLDLVVFRVDSIRYTSSLVQSKNAGHSLGTVGARSDMSKTGVERLNKFIKTSFSKLAFPRSDVATVLPNSRVGRVVLLDFTALTSFQNSFGLRGWSLVKNSFFADLNLETILFLSCLNFS